MFRFISTGLVLCTMLLTNEVQGGQSTVVSLTATIDDVFTKYLANGNVITKRITGLFYRDSHGRTRIDRGDLVIIQDPTTQTNIVINMKTKLARRLVSSSSNAKPASAPTILSIKKNSPYKDLGSRIMDGIAAKGIEYSLTVPSGAVGNRDPIRQITEVWYSEHIALSLMTKASNPLDGDHLQTYHDIVQGATVDPGLFKIPTDVRVEDVKPIPRK